MPRGVRIHKDAIRELMQTPGLVDGVSDIADACNEESSWGGYESEVTVDAVRARGRVWSRGGGEERANRMLRNLDRGKP